MKKKIYIAGPYSGGDVAMNVRAAIDVANQLADLGFAPYVPHFTHFWHMVHPRPYEFWLEHDNEYLPICDALFRIPGDSGGADKEVAYANELEIPVFQEIEAMITYFGEDE